MKKLSSNTRCNASDQVTTEVWSTKYNIPKPFIGKGTQGLKYQRCKAMHVSSYITWTDNRTSQISTARKHFEERIQLKAKNQLIGWIPKLNQMSSFFSATQHSCCCAST